MHEGDSCQFIWNGELASLVFAFDQEGIGFDDLGHEGHDDCSLQQNQQAQSDDEYDKWMFSYKIFHEKSAGGLVRITAIVSEIKVLNACENSRLGAGRRIFFLLSIFCLDKVTWAGKLTAHQTGQGGIPGYQPENEEKELNKKTPGLAAGDC